MKNKTGIISGFLAGSIGFMLLFKVIILNNTSPEDELAPGMVVIIAIVIGLASAFIGGRVENYFRRTKAN